MDRIDTAELEASATRLAAKAGVPGDEWRLLLSLLADLRDHDPVTYAHSLRVGMYSYGMASAEGFAHPHLALMAGCAHDIGKTEVDARLLRSSSLTCCEFEEVKKHAEAGFDRLQPHMLFVALVAGLHHRFRPQGYGLAWTDDMPHSYGEDELAELAEVTSIVMAADFFDALVTRRNNKGFVQNFGNPNEEEKVLLTHFSDRPRRIRWLMRNRLTKPGIQIVSR